MMQSPLKIACAWFCMLGSMAAAAPDAAIDFERDIAPIFRARCLNCHAGEANGGLRLDSRPALLKGGDSGEVIRAGASDESLLIQRVTAPADERMPPEGPPLTSEQIALLKRWIDAGAAWPEGVVLLSPRDAAASHWAFAPVQRPRPPVVSRSDAVRNAIDRFVLARLEQTGDTPSPEADRVTLLRRVTLDLIGLPPTADEVTRFLADDGADAYERAVDRLLASPEYGERWARPWLDLCHYGDTDGYLTDQERPVAWRYRDWLIGALNDNMPFDRFTIEQLAGDLLPDAGVDQLLATGFLRNTLSNREGGADLEEYRVAQIIDRTAIVGTGWLGLTVGCARCHDHKFDPISQREYFQFYAYLDQADEVNIDAPLPGEWEQFAAQYPEYRRKRDALIEPVREELEALQARWEKRMLEAVASPGQDPLWDRQWEVLGLIWGGHFGEGQLEGCTIVRTPVEERTVDERDRLLDYFLVRGSVVDPEKFAELKLDELRKALDELKATVNWPTRAPTMRQARHPREVHMHVRGDFRVPGEQVTPALFEWLPVDAPSSNEHAGTRLELARWLVAPDNPLTPRVVVNRMWQEFFGNGLVTTPDDFGLRGMPPSHPELLDWLASEFVRSGWDVKHMHRLIVTSATYRQSSHARPEIDERDPENQLLARQAPLRLSADQIRDATLAVSGLLERQIGGPSVFPPQPPAVAMESFSNEWKTSQGPDSHRRGLYTWVQRLSPYAQNVTFDAPPTSNVCVRRERTNTPLQALTLLNDPVFYEAAGALAKLALEAPVAGDAERIDWIFRRALGRTTSRSEMATLQEYLNSQRGLVATTGVSVTSGTEAGPTSELTATADVSSTQEVHVWTGLCSVILNLHEFITRD